MDDNAQTDDDQTPKIPTTGSPLVDYMIAKADESAERAVSLANGNTDAARLNLDVANFYSGLVATVGVILS